MIYPFFEFWPIGSHTQPQTLQVPKEDTHKRCFYSWLPTELLSKTLLLKTMHPWVKVHENISLAHNCKDHSCWLVFLVLESGVHALLEYRNNCSDCDNMHKTYIR